MNTPSPSVMSEAQFEAVRKYYRDKNVRRRIAEFCGGKRFSCEYLVGFGEFLVRNGYHRPIRLTNRQDDLGGLMEEGLDLFRSVWDKKSTLAVWDVEYFNLDTWHGLYRNQLTHFELMEPVYRAIEELLGEYGIPHLNDATSSGYHFISRIPFSSPVHRKLERVGRTEPGLLEKYALVPGNDDKRARPLPARAGRGYSGIGRLHEFLCHLVIRRTRGASPLPVTISDAAVGRMARGREGMSLDITQYADPLYMRDIRTTFSTHQKHKVSAGKVGEKLAGKLPVFATVPRNDLSFRELFMIRKDLRRAARYAARCSGVIPDASAGWERVITDYRASALFAFHREFDAVAHAPAARWPNTYWRLDLTSIPACAADSIRNVYWGLLNPTSIQNLCRVLFSVGWHPKHIAGLIRSYYETRPEWNTDWRKYHAETRANFWCRVYCGLLAAGTDILDDFTCITHQEKGYCTRMHCGFSLEDCREKIRDRVCHGKFIRKTASQS
ncbi:MAG: hypothetical protein V1789_09505 [PVC group bacterium]